VDILWEAWRQVKENKGAPGVDGMAIEWIINTGYEEEMIQTLHEALREHRYQFAPVRMVEIPKPKGGTRPLGIATIKDRVVQTAMKLVLEPIFEADFHDCSYGYRPKRDAKQASMAIRNDLYNRAWSVVEIDFQAYFTSIPHRKLMLLDIIGFKCCHRSSVNQKLAAGDDKKRGDCASRTQSPSRDPRCLLW
jgi:group II intron reverse transcriptase/maturase